MSMIRKKYKDKPTEAVLILRSLNKQEQATLAEIERLEGASLRSLRTVTIQGKTKAPDDVKFLSEYEEKIAIQREKLIEIRSQLQALLAPQEEAGT